MIVSDQDVKAKQCIELMNLFKLACYRLQLVPEGRDIFPVTLFVKKGSLKGIDRSKISKNAIDAMLKTIREIRDERNRTGTNEEE